MLLPLLILVGTVIAVRQVTKSPGEPFIKIGSPRNVTHTEVSGYQGYRLGDGNDGVVFETQLPESIIRLTHHLKSGVEPEQWLIDQAISDAYNAGRRDVVESLLNRFPPRAREQSVPHGDQADDSQQGDNVGTVIGKNSPFDGVSNEDWNRFVDRLATQSEDYRTDKHVGRYHHSRARLSQLGIDPESLTPDQQYDALVKDLSDSGIKSKELIEEFMCTPIPINGTDHMVTMSGLFTLLKAAGPTRARSWLLNESDRTQFPKTTEMFLQTNGMF